MGDEGMPPVAAAFDDISAASKALILKAARAVNARRALDAAPMFADMAETWQRGMDALAAIIGSR